MKTIAFMGGRGELPAQLTFGDDVRVRLYRSPRDGSMKDAARLCKSIKAGGVDLVIVWYKFNSHNATERVRKTCKRYDVPFRVYRGGGRYE